MSIEVQLDLMMVQKKIKLKDLAEIVGISVTNLSILKTGKAKAIRFSTLDALCKALDCQPGDILKFYP
jgi:putative transcriptional regulator